MLYAEKDAKRFEDKVHEACDCGDFWFILKLLGFEELVHEVCNNGDFLVILADRIKRQLMKAYNDLEDACLDSRNREGVCEPITSYLLSFMDSKTTKIQAINASIQKLKSQIHIRGLPEPPKFRSDDFNEEEWDYIVKATNTPRPTDSASPNI